MADDGETTLFTAGEVQVSTDSIPYSLGSWSSKEAARTKKATAARDKDLIYEFVKARNNVGCTSDEYEAATGMGHSTCSSRLGELEKDGRLVRVCRFRLTRAGKPAQVYLATDLFCWADYLLITGKKKPC